MSSWHRASVYLDCCLASRSWNTLWNFFMLCMVHRCLFSSPLLHPRILLQTARLLYRTCSIVSCFSNYKIWPWGSTLLLVSGRERAIRPMSDSREMSVGGGSGESYVYPWRSGRDNREGGVMQGMLRGNVRGTWVGTGWMFECWENGSRVFGEWMLSCIMIR